MDWPLWGGGRRRLGFRGWFEIWGKLQTLPPSKISDILRVGGRSVMSGVPNVGGIDFG